MLFLHKKKKVWSDMGISGKEKKDEGKKTRKAGAMMQ